MPRRCLELGCWYRCCRRKALVLLLGLIGHHGLLGQIPEQHDLLASAKVLMNAALPSFGHSMAVIGRRACVRTIKSTFLVSRTFAVYCPARTIDLF